MTTVIPNEDRHGQRGEGNKIEERDLVAEIDDEKTGGQAGGGIAEIPGRGAEPGGLPLRGGLVRAVSRILQPIRG